MSLGNNCMVCGRILTGKKTHFCSMKCKNTHHQSYEAQHRRGRARKLELVEAAGGRCMMCGYNRNLGALVFHHTDASKKNLKLDVRSLSNHKMELLLAELEKCILLCHNCHAEIHNPRLNLDSLVLSRPL